MNKIEGYHIVMILSILTLVLSGSYWVIYRPMLEKECYNKTCAVGKPKMIFGPECICVTEPLSK